MSLRQAIRLAVGASLALVVSGSSAHQQGEAFPFISIDLEERVVSIAGRVPIMLDDPRAPNVYLELIACTPNTKEHEVLVVTQARPSHLHAALLMLGLQPGRPATWVRGPDGLTPVAPEGDPVSIEFVVEGEDGSEQTFDPSDWIVHASTGERWPGGNWVFAGSRMRERRDLEEYVADSAGTLIGLASFGSEVLAWPGVIDPDSGVEEPVWIADQANVPALDTPVTIRIRPADDR